MGGWPAKIMILMNTPSLEAFNSMNLRFMTDLSSEALFNKHEAVKTDKNTIS